MHDYRIDLKLMLLPCCTSSGILFLKLEEKQLLNEVVALLVSFISALGHFYSMTLCK